MWFKRRRRNFGVVRSLIFYIGVIDIQWDRTDFQKMIVCVVLYVVMQISTELKCCLVCDVQCWSVIY